MCPTPANTSHHRHTTTPPQANTQSSPHPRSTRPNHPNPPRPTTTATLPQQDPQTFLAAETNTATRPLPPTSSHPHEPTRDTHAHPRCRIPTNISPPRFSIPRQESLPQPKNYECSTSRAPTCHKTKPQVDISNDPTPPWSIHSPPITLPSTYTACFSRPTLLPEPHTKASITLSSADTNHLDPAPTPRSPATLHHSTTHTTEQLCSDDLENPVQLPVQEVLIILSYKFLKFHHYLCFRGRGMYFWHSY